MTMYFGENVSHLESIKALQTSFFAFSRQMLSLDTGRVYQTVPAPVGRVSTSPKKGAISVWLAIGNESFKSGGLLKDMMPLLLTYTNTDKDIVFSGLYLACNN